MRRKVRLTAIAGIAGIRGMTAMTGNVAKKVVLHKKLHYCKPALLVDPQTWWPWMKRSDWSQHSQHNQHSHTSVPALQSRAELTASSSLWWAKQQLPAKRPLFAAQSDTSVRSVLAQHVLALLALLALLAWPTLITAFDDFTFPRKSPKHC